MMGVVLDMYMTHTNISKQYLDQKNALDVLFNTSGHDI